MRFPFIPSIIVLAALQVGFTNADSGELSITVKGTKGQNGTVYMSICSSTDEFSKDEAGKHYHFPYKAGTGTIKLEGLAPDRYALKLFVDLNGNGVIDMNMLGIPKEPYAFSNNEMGTFGPPSFEDASFPVEPGRVAVQQIHLRGE